MYETNVLGLLAVTQAVAPAMMRARRGTVVNVSSVIGFVALPFAGIYTSSKAALLNLSDVMRLELAPFGVEVVTVCPGAVRSNIGARSLERLDLGRFKLYAPFHASIKARAMASQIPASTPTDVFAERVVRDLLRPAPPKEIVWGFAADYFAFLRRMPRWFRDAAMAKRSGVNVVLPPHAD